MIRIFFWMYCLIFLFQSTLHASLAMAEVHSQRSFQSGLEHYSTGNYALALIDWHTLLQNRKYSESPEVNFNLGLTEFKLNDLAPALGHLRKAQSLKPLSIRINKTLKLVTRTIEEKEFYRVESESWFVLILNWIPKFFFISLFFIFLTLGTLASLRYNQPNPSPWIFFKNYIYFFVLSLIPLLFLFIQIHLQSQVFATLIGVKEGAIRTSPDSNSPEIGQLKIGDVFQILKLGSNEATDWLAISTSETAFGWIKPDSYIVHRGKIDPSASAH